jgi:hypothetical protein
VEKQIIIEGKNNDWYKKAIFIVEEKIEMPPHLNLAHYAEQIIENHMKTNQPIQLPTKGALHPQNTSKEVDRWINAFLVTSIVCLVGALIACYI